MGASSVPATATAIVKQTPSRFSALFSLDDLTAKYLKDNYLTGFVFKDRCDQELSDAWFEDKLANAFARFEEITNIDVLERTVVGEKHDYFVTDYLTYAFMQLYRIPAQRVSEVRAVYPTGQTVQVFPAEWVRITVEHSQFHLVPTAGTLAHILMGSGAGYLPFIFAGTSYLPSLWEVDYVSGFAPDAVPRDVVAVICKLACVEILTIMCDLIGPLGIASQSLGIDGMSQSTSRQLPAFKARLDAYKIDLGIPGPGLGVDGKFATGEIAQLRRTYLGMVMASL